ncbi:MAG: phosphatidylserine decarboxylase [Acidiferrobacter sp.]
MAITMITALAVAATVWAGVPLAVLAWLMVAFVVQFFRDPRRVVEGGLGVVLCPADGRVIAMGPATDPYLQRPALKFSIFMNVFNVHANRLPVTGRIRQQWYNAGRFFNAALDKASEHNERNALWIATADGHDVVVVQVAGLIARRILCYAQRGDDAEAGRRYGFIRFGSRVDVYLPPEARAVVALGDKVKGGLQILAQLPPARPPAVAL